MCVGSDVGTSAVPLRAHRGLYVVSSINVFSSKVICGLGGQVPQPVVTEVRHIL